jgi:hypothetical protein
MLDHVMDDVLMVQLVEHVLTTQQSVQLGMLMVGREKVKVSRTNCPFNNPAYHSEFLTCAGLITNRRLARNLFNRTIRHNTDQTIVEMNMLLRLLTVERATEKHISYCEYCHDRHAADRRYDY